MKYIRPTPNPSGAYPAPQSNPAPGLLELTEEQAAVVIRYNGFVTITTVDDSVTVTPNEEAWAAWKQSEADRPVPEAEPDEITRTQLAVAELATVVEDNNTANQLAIAELAEALLGGEG